MRGAFTRYLKELDARSEPSAESFDQLWEALRAALIYELKRCSLWAASPSFLGIFGWTSWMEGGNGPDRRTGALDELMNDAYSHVFLKRLPRLMAQLEVKTDVDGLVFLYLRNFIHDRRKAHDRLGFRVFENLRTAVRRAVASGDLRVVAGDPKVTSSTVLAFASGADAEEPAGAARLAAVVEGWNHDLVPDIMTASGPELQAFVERLRKRLLGIETEGIGVFRFRDLIGPLKTRIRSRWAAIFEQEGGESIKVESEGSRPTAVKVVQPDERPEIRDSFRKLRGRIADHLEKLEAPRKTRRYLQTLWTFLGSFACDEEMGSLPSNRQVASLLSIPRERLPGLYETLRVVLRHEGSPLGEPLRLADGLADGMRPAGLEAGRFVASSRGASP